MNTKTCILLVVVLAVVSAVVQLLASSEVSACECRIAALESELAAAASEHSSRLAQQQKAFLAKLEQLRQVHNQQVAAIAKDAQV